MAAKQILSLVVASTWGVNLLIDNQIKEPKAYAFGSFFSLTVMTNGVRSMLVST